MMNKFATKDELNLLRSRIDNLETMISGIRKSLNDLEKKMKNQKVGGGADQDAVDAIVDELQKLRKEFEEYRDTSNKRINSLENEMPLKANKSDLEDLENRIMEKLRDMIQQILNQFANKEDVMKRFAQLSKKIREIMELLAKQGMGNDNVDDAMFSKRHLGPLACASCEKNIINMYGQKVDHHVWNKLPFRDPNERIARYGQGFSKILSHMRPSDLLTGSGHSPGRNMPHPHHQSVDDTHLGRPTYGDAQVERNVHYVDAHSVDNQRAFYNRAGKTQQADRRSSTIGAPEGFGTSTTNPGTSDHMGDHQDGYQTGTSQYVKTPQASPNVLRFQKQQKQA